mgnify:CR=1 FL=1
MSLIAVTDDVPVLARRLFHLGRQIKEGADLSPAYNLSGMLYASKSGFLLLSVPNALVRGVFAAMDEPGIELPPGPDDGPFEAHISVMRPEELELIGGIDRISERGKRFCYRLGGLVSTEPEQSSHSRVWMLRVHSPELQALRRSYGLSSLPKDGEYDFHVTVAVRKRGVLGRNEKRKAANA